jgi:site-specific DNA recombinase
MLFEEYGRGCSSISGDLVRMAREWGLRNKTRKGGTLSASQIQHILVNPFYYGEMRIKGNLYRHGYPALISKELFDKCEQIRIGNSRASSTRYSHKPFVFRGLVKCATTRRTVTCDVKKGRHVYLICRDPAEPEKKLFVPESVVLDQVAAVFQSMQVPPKLLDALLAHMKAEHEAGNEFHRKAIERLRQENDKVRERLAILLDLRLDKRITQDEYDKKARDLKQSQTEVVLRIEQHQKGEGDFRTTLESLISLASRAGELFECSKIEQKRQLIAFAFSNLQLRGKKLEFSLRSPFDLMVNRTDYSSWLGN